MKGVFLSLLLILMALNSALSSDIKDAELIAAQKEYHSEVVFNLWLNYNKNPSSLTEFYNALTEKHVVTPHPSDKHQSQVVYFAKGNKDTDYILQSGGPDFYGLRFSRIGNSNYYYCIQNIPNDAWFNYGVNEFSLTKMPPESELSISSMEHIYDNSVIGPKALLSPYITKDSKVAEGRVFESNLASKSMNEDRTFAIYLPAGYDPAISHNLVIQLDGQNYASPTSSKEIWKGWTPMPTILDNLHSKKKLKPTIAIMVFNQGKRSSDMLDERFHAFIATELVPWARKQYTISNDRSNVIISGPSRAGFAASYTAFKHSDVFGGVLSQSGSFYYTLTETENWPIYPEFEGKILSDYKQSVTLPIRFYMDVGLYDLGLAGIGTNRQFKDILLLKGYSVEYAEYNGGHSHLSWRHRLHIGLLALLN